MKIDFLKNIKQENFFAKAVDQLAGRGSCRHLFYGGGIRGGKTFVSLAILAYAARRYPNSRWYVFRKDFPALLSTTIPSMEKILAGHEDWGWSRDKANYYCYYKPSGGRIYFKGENLAHDPSLNDLLGLEYNGVLFEQIEELSEKLWQVACSRLGSWYLPDMPAPITLATFNPTQSWVKRAIYEPYIKGELREPYYYLPALPHDNGYVTAEQWQAWEMLDDQYRRRFIEGDWADLEDTTGRWAFAYDAARHGGYPEVDRDYPLYLSFDFNRNPICCAVIQYIDDQLRVLAVIKLADSDIYALCTRIRVLYPDMDYRVTGDASGQNKSALVRDSATYFTVIREQLPVNINLIDVPLANPRLADNQALINIILSQLDVQIHQDKAAALHYDLANVKKDSSGGILKDNRRDPKQQADALDAFRYYCNTYLSHVARGRVVEAD
jgi:hypothetical protein